jgi:hypothetical protein
MILDETELCFGELAYENRLVAFFDILGWKSEIAAAGNDPRYIARLAAAVRMFNANTGVVGDAGARLTTALSNVANRLNNELMATDDPKTCQKLAWLFDRVVRSFGGYASADMLPKSASLQAALAQSKTQGVNAPAQ